MGRIESAEFRSTTLNKIFWYKKGSHKGVVTITADGLSISKRGDKCFSLQNAGSVRLLPNFA